ncbi:LysR family transcriptional regulator [Rhizobiaceae bacterium n13]|uniref:LysR family transcriptional regulator n=1 Tax=Ferirhizobium litorale TaxID=2927786 RepID=A0AAE3QFF7_9HYPH|nr:LysR family transcriptional regulator [Fererhizobium litorale]MDI7863755.1 LysR family transcriptional regulator [Fererhizobium litorale]MDI7924145.1 LysR family transcriptional regulator [Fererhizobium litorale]
MKKAGMIELNAVAIVAETRNFRSAARQLGMSASAVSHAISALESRLGVRLFNRTTRSVSLTEAGEGFLEKIAPALKEIESAVEGATEAAARPRGRLRINSSAGGVRGHLMPLLMEYRRRYPDVDIDVASDGRLVDIVAEGFDLGMRLLESVPQDMVAIPLTAQERFLVFGAPEYFERHGRPAVPADLLKHDCVRFRLPGGAIYRWEFERHGEEIRLDVPGRMTLQDMDLILEAAVAGAGLAYMTKRHAAAEIAAGRLQAVLEEWTPPFPGLCLYFSSRRHLPAAVRAFIDLVREMTRTP